MREDTVDKPARTSTAHNDVDLCMQSASSYNGRDVLFHQPHRESSSWTVFNREIFNWGQRLVSDVTTVEANQLGLLPQLIAVPVPLKLLNPARSMGRIGWRGLHHLGSLELCPHKRRC